jgi:Stage II sporulation protein E (SpoIIE)
VDSYDTEQRIARMVDAAVRTPAGDVLSLLVVMCDLLGAREARFHVADYSLRRLQQVDRSGRVGPPQRIAGTLLGRAFTSSEIVLSGTDPITVSVPLVEGTSRVGVLELDYDVWGGEPPKHFDAIVAVFVMTWVLKSRYGDASARARRSQPLSAAAEVQWELLPPLSCSTEQVALSGILEPAYDIGGDSFDYAFDASRLDFAMVDAIGHGLSAVLMSAAAINSLRNSRRAETGIAAAYDEADRSIATQFGHSYFVTAIIGSLDLPSGTLTWVNAGHVAPMLVRNGTYAGTLQCKASRPLGLGGPVLEVAEVVLQRGDRVLFYTDGITESRSPDGSFFGDDRLSDFLVRAALEDLPVHESVRHLSESVIEFNGEGLRDDATMLLLEWRGARD